jgi:sec-independent protein translocase protein TatA
VAGAKNVRGGFDSHALPPNDSEASGPEGLWVSLIREEECMFGIGMPELIVILVIVLIIFGAGKLPQIGEGIGKGIRNFRKATKGPDEIDVTPDKDEEVSKKDD